MIGSVESELAKVIESTEILGLSVERQKLLIDTGVHADIISQYPEFSRKQIDLDQDIKQQIVTYAFPTGYTAKISK